MPLDGFRFLFEMCWSRNQTQIHKHLSYYTWALHKVQNTVEGTYMTEERVEIEIERAGDGVTSSMHLVVNEYEIFNPRMDRRMIQLWKWYTQITCSSYYY